jgi:metal-dependent amidase/aminoacylase/carboxypeptidase family protein
MILCLGKTFKINYYSIRLHINSALNSIGHACGHNVITVQGLACALSMKALMEQDLVQGTVVLYGTPAEETTSGKISIVNAGLLKENVDYSMMLVSFCWVEKVI